MKEWVSATVAIHYRKSSCKPTDDLRTWYEQLRAHAATTQIGLPQRYDLSMSPLAWQFPRLKRRLEQGDHPSLDGWPYLLP